MTSYPALRPNRETTSRIPCSSSTTTRDGRWPLMHTPWIPRGLPTGWPAAEKAERAPRAPAPARTVRRRPRRPRWTSAPAEPPAAPPRRVRQPWRSAARTPRSTNTHCSVRSRQMAIASPLEAAVMTSQPQPASAADDEVALSLVRVRDEDGVARVLRPAPAAGSRTWCPRRRRSRRQSGRRDPARCRNRC